jgi:hypothetical protein
MGGDRRSGWGAWWWGGVGCFLIPQKFELLYNILNVRGYPFVYLVVG